MITVVFEATPVSPKPSGVGLCILNLLAALNSLQEEENLKLTGISYYPSFRNWLRGNWTVPEVLRTYNNLHVLPLPVRIFDILAYFPSNPIISHIEQPFGSPHIYHGTNFAVYPCRNSLRVMNIYDLSFIRYPSYVSKGVRAYAQRVRQCLKWTDLVITNAESSKQEIVEYLGVSPERVWVTPLASRYSSEMPSTVRFSPPPSVGDRPYILFVSTLEPRKNVVALIRAFERLKTEKRIDHQLILIGQRGWQFEPIFQAIEASPWRDHIHHLGYLSDAEVGAYYAHADVFAYPSFYEGFGLPVLEAMTLGCPVITSNVSSLPEVAGDAALMIDPTSIEQLAMALEKVICDRALRQQLIDKGHQRAALFSWTHSAKNTIAAYRSLL